MIMATLINLICIYVLRSSPIERLNAVYTFLSIEMNSMRVGTIRNPPPITPGVVNNPGKSLHCFLQFTSHTLKYEANNLLECPYKICILT